MNILLIAIIAILGINIFEGYRKGLVKIAVSIVAMLLTSVLVCMLTPTIGSFLRDETKLYEIVNDKTTEFIKSQNIGEELIEKQEELVAKELKLPQPIVELIAKNNTAKTYKELGVSTFEEYIGGYLARIIVDAIAFVVTYIIVMLIFKVILLATDIITKIPGIHGANKIIGGVVGFAKGIIIVWFAFIIITMLMNTAFGKTCSDMINESEFLLWIYNNNLLLKIITNSVL